MRRAHPCLNLCKTYVWSQFTELAPEVLTTETIESSVEMIIENIGKFLFREVPTDMIAILHYLKHAFDIYDSNNDTNLATTEELSVMNPTIASIAPIWRNRNEI